MHKWWLVQNANLMRDTISYMHPRVLMAKRKTSCYSNVKDYQMICALYLWVVARGIGANLLLEQGLKSGASSVRLPYIYIYIYRRKQG